MTTAGANASVGDRSAPMTERLLRDAGIAAGMRVLDVGCGSGAVTFMVARLVGSEGIVVGLDLYERATQRARERARELGIGNVEFITGDLRAPPGGRPPYDAIVGRRVLMHQPDRSDRFAAVRGLAELVRAGGIVAFQEVDGTMVPASSTTHPLHVQVTRWIWQTVQRSGATTAMGFELPAVLRAAGLEIEGLRAEAIVQTAGHGHCTAAVARAMLPLIVKHGVATEAEIDIETLDARLADELERVASAFIGDVVFSAWARKPL